MSNCLISDARMTFEIDKKINLIADCLLDKFDMNIGLMSGKAGLALFWAYYSTYSETVRLENTLVPLISEIVQGVKKSTNFPTFASGLSGIGWTFEHLKQNGFIDIDTNSLIGSFDDFLYPLMLKFIRSGNYDYMHGALGIGLYYLNRTSNPKTILYIKALIDELEKQGKYFNDSIAWESKLHEEMCFNLSLSHGIASIISILSYSNQINISNKKTANLVEKAINYLLGNKNDPDLFKFQFPRYVNKMEPQNGRLGQLSWCYNDLGISMALWKAGEVFNNNGWKQEAIKTLLSTTNITEWKDAGVRDACLCHGTAGIAHIYHRAYNYTGIEKLKKSAIYWFEQSLKMACFDDGLAGYKTYRSPGQSGFEKNYSFLEGVSGIGLAMISAVSDIEPAWDSSLLLS